MSEEPKPGELWWVLSRTGVRMPLTRGSCNRWWYGNILIKDDRGYTPVCRIPTPEELELLHEARKVAEERG